MLGMLYGQHVGGYVHVCFVAVLSSEYMINPKMLYSCMFSFLAGSQRASAIAVVPHLRENGKCMTMTAHLILQNSGLQGFRRYTVDDPC